ncbi:hypothetical protein ACQ4PT_044318 [Festuca glaucescens]
MAASPTASASGSVAAAAAAASEANDGPVLSVVSKRLRALRKKQNRIAQMEESAAAGKTLNQEQKEVLRSKPIVAALIDELERLRSPLSAALTEELSTVPAPSAAPAPAPAAVADSSIQDLLALVYFGSLFDVKPQSEFIATMVAREHERSSCISYDYVGDDTVDLLVENDLNTVSALAALAAARPASAVGVSHRDALQACANHARLWLARAEEPISPDTPATYAAVRTKLERIMASEYYTAAAVGGVQIQETMSASPEAPSVEENLAAEGHKEEKEESHATEICNDYQSNVADVQDVDGEAPVIPPEKYPSAEAEQEKFDVEGHDQRDAEPEEQQFQQPRRSQHNQRGGGRGRRGYPNGSRGGRGGRGVGGGGYYNNDDGYYQQRNYNNNRGRGGRSGGNSYYNNQGGGQQGGGQQYAERVELGANA